ncbi:MAG: carboxypeptidase-like regulatory domain-containing protein [Rhodothermales bacterium]
MSPRIIPSRFIPGILALLLAAGFVAELRAQDLPYRTLSGAVKSADTGEALPGVHVFIGRTMIGTVTDADGRYELARVPYGKHKLWASIVGFETTSRDIAVGDTTRAAFDFELPTAVIEIGELTVEAKRDRRWRKRFETFERLFIGESQNAGETVILNPEVLDFDASWVGSFRASAAGPLLIENRALGYRIQYFLKEFEREGGTIRYDGDPLFEDLEPASPEEAAYWEENRRTAFYGSLRHFLLALWDRRSEAEGFELYRIPSIEDFNRNDRRFSIEPDELFVPAGIPTERLLTFHGLIEITYTQEREEQKFLSWQSGSPHRPLRDQRSWIRLTDGPTEVDDQGEIIDPYGVTVYGYFAFERMANEVPKEYRPEGNTYRKTDLTK